MTIEPTYRTEPTPPEERAEKRLEEQMRRQREHRRSEEARETLREQSLVNGLEIVTMSDIADRETDWLWEDRIPVEMTSVVAGPPDIGKSLYDCYLAAMLTTGGRCSPTGKWCDGADVPDPCDVLLIVNEDHKELTLRPRLLAAGANMRRVHAIVARHVEATDVEGPTKRLFSLKDDIPELERVLDRFPAIKLISVNPVGEFLGGAINANMENAVRGVLAPLTEFVTERKVALSLTMHQHKATEDMAMNSVMGSIAFVAAPRAAHMIGYDPKDESKVRRIFAPFKSNHGPKPSSMAFHIEGVVLDSGARPGRIVWEGVTETTADQMCQPRTEISDECRAAMDFLRKYLMDEPRPCSEVFAAAERVGITKNACRTAATKLGIFDGASKNKQFGGSAPWAIPGHTPQST